MPKYSELPHVEEAFRRWVLEEDPPAGALYPAPLAREPLERALAAIDPETRVHPIVDPTVEHSLTALAVKATRLFPEGATGPGGAAGGHGSGGLLYAQLDVHLSRFGRAALVRWEWRRSKAELEATFGAAPPLPSARAEALHAQVRRLIEEAGVPIVSAGEAERVVRVADDPRYEGEYYEIKVFEALWGMGYPERQR